MKSNFLLAGTILLLVTSLICVGIILVPFGTSNSKEVKSSNFAVVELFTSEGCSSCPAADELLGQQYSEYTEKKLPVYFLAFHVDYWNYLGWKDEYANKEFTERQYRYGESFGLQSVYTPQMIVNGTTEFVGSNRSRLESAVKSALNTEEQFHIDLKGCLVLNDSTIKIVYAMDSLSADMTLNFAIVERGLSREIKRGENSGKRLHHTNVVRGFYQSNAKNQSEKILAIPKGIIWNNASLIVFAQYRSSMKIAGAASLGLTLE